MGNEVTCKVQFGKQQSAGKALLETSEILFRGGFRLKIPFSTIKSAKAVDGELLLQTVDGLAIFHLGAAAAKWCDKILHPKSRTEKLGVNPGAKISLLGSFAPDFLAEISELTKSVKGAAALWIVYPKGQKHMTENDVLAAGRKTGLKDVKVVAFSSTHTALKFVIPLSN